MLEESHADSHHHCTFDLIATRKGIEDQACINNGHDAADAQASDLRLPGDFDEVTAERMRREFRFGIAECGFAFTAAGYQAKIGASEDVSEGDATARTVGFQKNLPFSKLRSSRLRF